MKTLVGYTNLLRTATVQCALGAFAVIAATWNKIKNYFVNSYNKIVEKYNTLKQQIGFLKIQRDLIAAIEEGLKTQDGLVVI